MVEAIETRYKGHRFRSRTEARWAVWLDALGIRWRYEVEGLKLRVGEDPTVPVQFVYYLPDFYLPDFDTYVEIKGKAPDDEEDRKARLLAEQSGRKVLLFAGPPLNPKYRHPADPHHLLYTFLPDDNVVVTKNMKGGELAKFFDRLPNDASWLASFGEAMGARFEHGEKPFAANRREIL